MLRIIYGPSGSGKSHRIYELMKEDAGASVPSFLIVPEQETVQCERKLLDILPRSAQLSSEVLNFSRLANLVFRKYGGLSYNYADKGSRTLIMWRNIKELAPLLNEYSKQAEGNGATFANEMLSAISELKAYCITPEKLERAAEKIEGNEILKNKLLDLSLIMSAYQNYFSESFSDASDDLTKLAEAIKENDFFNGVNVYIDSFTSFTMQEYNVIEEICRGASNVTVSLTLDSLASTQIHYESTANTLLSLKKIAERNNIEVIEEKLSEVGAKAGALNEISNSLWDPSVQGLDTEIDGSIRVIKCATPYEEAEAAANIVCSLLMGGLRCRDIAVIARDASLYKGIIDNTFQKAQIPYFFSQSSDIMSKPPVKFLLSALRIKIYNWRSEDVISYLKSGICQVSDRDIDLLECYLSTWNIRGSAFTEGEWTMNPDGYSEYLTDRGKEILRRVNLCKNSFVPPLLRLFTALDNGENATDMCRAIYSFMEECNMAGILNQRAIDNYGRGQRKESAELLQLYNSIVKALENISVSLDDSKITVKEFADALKIMLDSISVGAIPTAADQVIIGSASMLRASSIKCAILIGLNEGEFPQTVKENGIFSDLDKRTLGELGLTLSADSSTRSSDELFYIYRAMSSPSEKLIVLFHASDLSGTATPISIGGERLLKLFPKLKMENYSDFELSDTMLYREGAFEKLAFIKDQALFGELMKYFERIDDYKNRRALAEIPTKNNVCTLSPETVDIVYGTRLRLTQSIIDNYVGCPFEYMCQRLLSLNDVRAASFDYANFGTYIHYIFENYLKSAVADRMIGKEPDPIYIEKKVNEAADSYISSFFKNGELSAPRLMHRFERMRNLAKLVATNITREFSQSNFKPEFFELNIGRLGGDLNVSPLVFNSSGGRDVYLVGRVDRVDILRKDGDVFVRVIDYKSGKKPFSQKDIEKGLNIQLPLYLFALCDKNQLEFKKALGVNDTQELKPVGAMYLSSLIDSIEVHEKEYDKNSVIKMAEESIVRSGFLIDDDEILKEMNFDMSAQYLCGAKRSASGKAPSEFISSDAMNDLKGQLKSTILGIADTMTSGNMSPAPSFSGNQFRCENCQMRAVCRAKRTN